MAKKKKISFYIIDDDPDMVEMMTMLLKDSGHAVSSSTSSKKALAEIQSQEPDCVIADVMMPEMDGIELCKQLRSKTKLKDMLIVMISAKAYEFDQKRALEFGADGFLVKPVNAETFVDKLEHIIEDHMEMTFWGVRGTLPVPGRETLEYGGNTSCVTLEFAKGQIFVFDAGSGIKPFSNHLMARGLKNIKAQIFISHPHWDHINALPFFVPLYIPGNEFQILGASHGDTTTREMISAQMDGVYFPITLKEFGARVYFKDLTEGTIEIEGVKVSTKLLNHPGQCLGYRVDYKGRSFCYITDNELYLEDHEFHNLHYMKTLIEFIGGTDALITDTTYTDAEYATKVGWGHSCVSQVVDLADRANVKNLYLFHHDPDQTDADIDAKFATAKRLLEERGSKTNCLSPKERQMFKI